MSEIKIDTTADLTVRRYRVYTNHYRYKKVWVVDQGTVDTQTFVEEVMIFVPAKSDGTSSPIHPEPEAWLVVEGVLTVEEINHRSVAVLRAETATTD